MNKLFLGVVGTVSSLSVGVLAASVLIQTKREYLQNPDYGSLWHTYQHRMGHIRIQTTYNNSIILCRQEGDISSTIYQTSCNQKCPDCKKLLNVKVIGKTPYELHNLTPYQYYGLPWFNETIVESK